MSEHPDDSEDLKWVRLAGPLLIIIGLIEIWSMFNDEIKLHFYPLVFIFIGWVTTKYAWRQN
jgi:hypothetical protein